jgi:mRNA-capping enzyme
MYIRDKDEVFMADRDNSIFKVKNLFFPHRKDLKKHLKNTLIDGVRFLFLINYFSKYKLFIKKGIRC